MIPFAVAVAGLLARALPVLGTARGPHRADFPCAGCAVSVGNADAGPPPLVVLLHGDGEGPAGIFARWDAIARGRATVVALACPAAAGCPGSWWRWNGDPAWIGAQVDHVAAAYPVDGARRWLVAWSGGASYVGWNTQRFERMFSAIVLHGGGMGPGEDACVQRGAPLYFLVGDRNPLHSLAVGLRRHYEACGEAVTWDLLPGADHAGEWAALDRRGQAVFEWLAARPPRASAAPP